MLTHFPTVTQSTGFQPEPLLKAYCSLLKPSETVLPLLGGVRGGFPSQRLRLEAYTFSNRGRSLRIDDISKISWLEASTKIINNQQSLLTL